MRCRVGDLAVVTEIEDAGTRFLGQILTVTRLSNNYPDAWQTEPRLYAPNGRIYDIADGCLRPIRDQPGQDETLTWKALPSPLEIIRKETA